MFNYLPLNCCSKRRKLAQHSVGRPLAKLHLKQRDLRDRTTPLSVLAEGRREDKAHANLRDRTTPLSVLADHHLSHTRIQFTEKYCLMFLPISHKFRLFHSARC